MEELPRRARTQPDLEPITLAVASGQTAARNLYLQLDFQIYGREPQALKAGQVYADEDLMILFLHKTRNRSGGHSCPPALISIWGYGRRS